MGVRGDRVAYEDAVGEGRAHVFDGDPAIDPARCGEIVLEVTAAPWPERPEEWSEGSLLCPECADSAYGAKGARPGAELMACPYCEGALTLAKGFDPRERVPCSHCHGGGWVSRAVYEADRQREAERDKRLAEVGRRQRRARNGVLGVVALLVGLWFWHDATQTTPEEAVCNDLNSALDQPYPDVAGDYFGHAVEAAGDLPAGRFRDAMMQYGEVTSVNSYAVLDLWETYCD